MKTKPFYLVLLALLLLGSVSAYGQELSGPQPKRARTPADYTLRTLKEIADLGTPLAAEVPTPGNLLPSRVKLTYQGSTRALPKIKREVIAQWANRYGGAPQHYIASYTTEVLFREGASSHWLVVNQSVIPRLKRAVKIGGAVDLYLIRLGAYKAGEKWRWVLLVENFAE